MIQDLANVYVYLPRQLAAPQMGLSLAALCGAVCLLLATGGGPIQQRLASKSHVDAPRAATLIATLYALILTGFSAMSRGPLSTTWVFLGLLAGREMALQLSLRERSVAAVAVAGVLGGDIARAALGLAVSVAVALLVPALRLQWGLA